LIEIFYFEFIDNFSLLIPSLFGVRNETKFLSLQLTLAPLEQEMRQFLSLQPTLSPLEQ